MNDSVCIFRERSVRIVPTEYGDWDDKVTSASTVNYLFTRSATNSSNMRVAPLWYAL